MEWRWRGRVTSEIRPLGLPPLSSVRMPAFDLSLRAKTDTMWLLASHELGGLRGVPAVGWERGEGQRDLFGELADLWRERSRGGGTSVHSRSLRARDQLLRHGQRLHAGGGRGDRGSGAQGLRAGLLLPRDEGVLPDGGGAKRQWSLAQAHNRAVPRLTQAPQGRLRGSLPVPPLRRRDAARGDPTGP